MNRKPTPTIPITPHQAWAAAKLCEILYCDQYDAEVKRTLRAWIRALGKAQKLREKGHSVSVRCRPGRAQLMVVSSKRFKRTSKSPKIFDRHG